MKACCHHNGRRPGQQGPLQEVRSAPTVVRASAYPEDHTEEDGNDDVASACQVGNCSIDGIVEPPRTHAKNL